MILVNIHFYSSSINLHWCIPSESSLSSTCTATCMYIQYIHGFFIKSLLELQWPGSYENKEKKKIVWHFTVFFLWGQFLSITFCEVWYSGPVKWNSGQYITSREFKMFLELDQGRGLSHALCKLWLHFLSEDIIWT